MQSVCTCLALLIAAGIVSALFVIADDVARRSAALIRSASTVGVRYAAANAVAIGGVLLTLALLEFAAR